jgi:hypothetical protein
MSVHLSPEFILPVALSRVIRNTTFHSTTHNNGSAWVVAYHYNRKIQKDEILWRGDLTLDQLSSLNKALSDAHKS